MEIIFETADCEKVQATTVIFRGKSLSKNKLTCKNAVARIYGSCTLRVMGSWFGCLRLNIDNTGVTRKFIQGQG